MTLSVVLLSGGLDSTTTLAMALREGDAVALTFDYGQRHSREVERARRIAEHYGIQQIVFPLYLQGFSSALIKRGDEIPDGVEVRDEIPATYVPARNILFLSIALGVAESIGADSIHIGVNAVDYSGYPDCRPEFIEAFQRMADVGTKTGVEGRAPRIRTPILNMSKGEIVSAGTEMNVPWELTWSCYRGGEKACGRCDTCLHRLKGFREAGIDDPIPYEGAE